MAVILAIDQGTTGTTVLTVDQEGSVTGRAYQEIEQHYPRPGWVEHDPGEIWRSVQRTVAAALEAAGNTPEDVAGIGITNQRETVVVWDRESGEPIHRAIVWQCRRTAPQCRTLEKAGRGPLVRERSGLVIDPYFSGTKIAWLLDNVPGARRRAEAVELAAGTIDSWLIWKLTAGRTHATEPTNASRTQLYRIDEQRWDPELCGLLGVPEAMLPAVRPSGGVFGISDGRGVGLEAPIASAIGDQQAALYGQGCWEPGLAKCTYGTGAFLLVHTGDELVPSRHGLLTTVACGPRGGATYALEGSVFIAGAAVQWLRDELGVVSSAAETEDLARSLATNEGVYFVPAFVGLGAPHWLPEARGMLVGLTRGSGRRHLARASLEAMAFAAHDLMEAMAADWGRPVRELRADGGAAANDWLMQFQSDIAAIRVGRPRLVETTALGAAGLAGLAVGFWSDPGALREVQALDRQFEPALTDEDRGRLLKGWRRALVAAEAWARAGVEGEGDD
ncbi:MAG: glycerol kinase GlpK [Gemmatimonadota bacterium]|nr:MAG: glycerol kinase GlpK [Gemmatimonadota bacterium]